METRDKITLYVSDLDGTLLGGDARLSRLTVDVLNALAGRSDVLFTAATARTPATVSPIFEGVNTRVPIIVIGGAALWDNARQCYSHTRPHRPEDIVTIADIMERHGLQPFIYRRHGSLLLTHHNGAMSPQEETFVAQRQGLPLKRFLLDDANYRYSDDEALLIFSMNHYAALRAVRDEVMAATPCTVMLYHDPDVPTNGYLEIYAAGTSKSAAIATLKAMTGAERVVVFGDNRNDLDMMRAADQSVAVANAFDEVKAAASEVIGPNTDDSVARWIAREVGFRL